MVNKLRGTLRVAAVKAPGFGDRRKAMLEDIAVLSGGKMISEDLGIKLENVTWEDLGTARKIAINKDDTTIVVDDDDAAKHEAVLGRVQQIIGPTVDVEFDSDKADKSLAGQFVITVTDVDDLSSGITALSLHLVMSNTGTVVDLSDDLLGATLTAGD